MENKFDPNVILGAAVSLVSKDLTDHELAALNIAMQLGEDPRGVIGFEKVKHLFTLTKEVEDPITHQKDTIPFAHQAVQEAFASIVLSRLAPVKSST